MRRPVVLCSLPMDPAGLALLEPVADVEAVSGPSPESLFRLLPKADFLVVRTFLPAGVLDRPHRLRAIVRHGSGLDMIPMDAATRQGIPVAYVPGANAQAVAEYVVGSFFELARRFGGFDRALRSSPWAAARSQASGTVELAGKTVGIVGVGEIGRRVAGICATGLGMNVLGFQPDPSRFPGHVKSVRLEELLKESDFVTLNCPLTDATRNMIDAARLGLMKPTAFLVNAARGAVIVESDLMQTLRMRAIAGAALDVFTEQPLADDHPFRGLDNLLITPHVAALTRESAARMSVGSAEAILQLMHGKRPQHLANPEVWAAWSYR